MWTDIASPIIIGHRGDKAYAPENTVASFEQAIKKGADAIEFDVKLTGDEKVIILHDQTVDRTTDGSGNVAKLSLESLRILDAGVLFPGQFPGEKIPTLEEVFETVGKRIFMNIELTNYATPKDALVQKVVELIKKHRMQHRVLLSSFFARNLRKARSLLPEVPRGLLTLPGLMGFWGRSFGWRGNYDALNPYFTNVNDRLVKSIHLARKRVNVWTVNSENDIKCMVEMNVDGIITDDPAFALRLVGRR